MSIVRALSSQVLLISRDGDPTTSLIVLTKNNVLLCLNFLYLVPNFTCPIIHTTEKSLVPFSLLLPSRYLYIFISSFLSLLFSRMNSLSFSSYERCSNLLITFVTVLWTCYSAHTSLLWGSLEKDTAFKI